jgi:hypothetical protein
MSDGRVVTDTPEQKLIGTLVDGIVRDPEGNSLGYLVPADGRAIDESPGFRAAAGLPE